MLLPQQLVTRLVNTGLLGDEKDIVYCGTVDQVKNGKRKKRVLMVADAAIYTFVVDDRFAMLDERYAKLSKTLNSKSVEIVECDEENKQVKFSATLAGGLRKTLTIELADKKEYKELSSSLEYLMELNNQKMKTKGSKGMRLRQNY